MLSPPTSRSVFRPTQLRRTREAALRDASSRDKTTRASALGDLVFYADDDRTEVIGALERGLGDEASEVRAAAAVALADVHAVEALPTLLFAVEDDDPFVRQMALSAVGELGDPRARERLRRALSDARAEVRFQAVIGFVRVAPDEALEALTAALGDPDGSIRYIALRSAEELALASGEPLSPEFLARAEQALDDASQAVQVAAAILLAPSGRGRSHAVLVDVVKGELVTREAEDEAAAIELVGDLGLEEARPSLMRRAFGLFGFRSDRFAWQAMVALARMGDARARAQIARDLSSWSRDRRTLAVAAAGRAGLSDLRPLVLAMRGDHRRAEPTTVDITLQQLETAPLISRALTAGETAS